MIERVRRTLACCVRLVLLLFVGCTQLEAEVGSDPPAAAAPKCDSAAPFGLYYWNVRPEATAELIDFLVKVENRTGAPVPLATLGIRYYFKDELPTPATLDVFYGDTCCTKKSTFKERVLRSVRPASGTTRADSYIEIGFEPSVGELAPGDAVQVEIGYQDAASVESSTQSNDYSFLATAIGTQSDWDACPGPACLPSFTNCALTVDQAGMRVWGAPP